MNKNIFFENLIMYILQDIKPQSAANVITANFLAS